MVLWWVDVDGCLVVKAKVGVLWFCDVPVSYAKCYALGERPARLELGGYDSVVWHVVLEACASDTQ